MRTILFRGEITGTDGWIYGLPYSVYGDGVDSIQDVKNKLVEYIDINTVGEFSGLLDINGVKIFEGDVCNFIDHPTNVDSCTAEVKFSEGNFIDGCMGRTINNYGYDWTEVIGNIHDNAELLK